MKNAVRIFQPHRTANLFHGRLSCNYAPVCIFWTLSENEHLSKKWAVAWIMVSTEVKRSSSNKIHFENYFMIIIYKVLTK